MNKIYIALIAFLFLFFNISPLKDSLIEISNSIKNEIIFLKKSIYEKLTFFKNQQQQIKHLKLQNQNLMFEVAKLNSIVQNCKNLKEFKKISKSNLYFVQTISYAALPDFTQIYVNYPKKVQTPKGLVYNNMAAGIVVKNFGNYSLALLNSNPKTTYTVIIGDKEIPGIFYGGKNVVKYIKKYVPIKKGDIVKTSGLDGIFYKGVLVGIVEDVKEKKLYQEVKIKLFYDKMTPDFFYVVEKNATIKKTLRRGNGNESN